MNEASILRAVEPVRLMDWIEETIMSGLRISRPICPVHGVIILAGEPCPVCWHNGALGELGKQMLQQKRDAVTS